MKKHKEIIERIIYATLIASTFIIVVNPSIVVCLFFSNLLLLLFLTQYAGNNPVLYRNILLVCMASWSSIIVTKWIMGGRFRVWKDWELLCFVILILEILFLIKGCVPESEKKAGADVLYPERMDDLNRIRDYMTQVYILGVNAVWGMGKTFLMECLKSDKTIQQNYEVIQIDLLSCDLDEVEIILIEEIEKIFKKNRIYPSNSYEMKRILGKSKWFELLGGLVFGTAQGMAASFDRYQKEFGKLQKKILVIFEDIDRISEKQVIQKIFAISEKLAGEKLHVIYQFDEGKLDEIGLNRNYLEKYIPYVVNLTEIPYESIVDYQWEPLNMADTKLDKRDVVLLPTNLPGSYRLRSLLGVEMSVSIELRNLSIRKVSIFLTELRMLLLENPDFQEKDIIKTVTTVIFIKHFFHDYYKMFRVTESPWEQFSVSRKDEKYSVQSFLMRFRKVKGETKEQLQQRIQDMNAFMDESENRECITILLLLDYDFEGILQNEDEGAWQADKEAEQKRREKNNKIDRIIWKVVANGTSDITDSENAVQKLTQDVLSKEGEQQQIAWNSYLNDMYQGHLKRGNHTIFKLGKEVYESLFQAMKICNAKSGVWRSFLEFYISQYEKNSGNVITKQLVTNLAYCNLNSKINFFLLIRFFNGLQVDGNLNHEKAYSIFYEKFMSAITTLGYGSRMEFWMFEMREAMEGKEEFAFELLEQLQQDLEEQMNDWNVDYIRQEFLDCVEFVHKNQELITCSYS